MMCTLTKLVIPNKKEGERGYIEMGERCFTHVRVPQQKSYDGIPFPTVLSPNLNNTTCSVQLQDGIKDHKAWLESLLHETGAILFRGFPVSSPRDFNDVVEAFGYDELVYFGGAALRTSVVGRVYTANDGPLDQHIHFHHEMSMQPEFPSKLFFYCYEQPRKGGETPIVLSHILYERMKEKNPEFVTELEEHGLIYTRILIEEDDLSSPIGRGWKSTFLTNDKTLAEKRAAEQGMELEWIGNDAKTIRGPLPAIKLDDTRDGRKIWFNTILTGKKEMTFGNGKSLPDNIIDDCLKIANEECVAIPWQKGDILFLDNLAVLHARRPLITPPRRILASLCK